MAHAKTLNLTTLETRFEPWQARAVSEQLKRILLHPAFRNSRRYPAFLRYVVERTLEGGGDELKERTLGVEVFGRDLGYDTNADHIVRTTAGEIRKRIAQYYHEPGHETEVRIDIPSGSYVPEFRWPSPQLDLEKPPESASPSSWFKYLIPSVAIVVLIIAIGWVRTGSSENALDQFWGPVLHASGPVLLCLGVAPGVQPVPPVNPETVTLGAAHQSMSHMVSIGDAVTLARLTSFLGTQGKKFQVRSELNSTLDDLRNGPVILIGAFNNNWTMRLTEDSRFTFARDPNTLIFRIKDKQNPSANWPVDMAMPLNSQTADYAVVSRVFDSTTQRIVVMAAGIGTLGTIAAGEFLTDPQYMKVLSAHAPKDWQLKNVQVVLTTQVINGHSGPPRVVVANFW